MILKLIATFSALILLCPSASTKSTPNEDWWKHGVFYQIYPRSFKDSNGDGIGDLQGIKSKLEHLKDAGVTATWLSPIYKSPQVDAGYDISDFRDIHHEYGTLEDFAELVNKTQELGLKIIMDFVPNHSSDQHEWFKKSEKKEPGYEDYYVWANGKDNDDKTPPNNWLSVFKYSAWQYSTIREQWYLHQFAIQQPDLNFNNPKVVEEMKNVLIFWMDRGVYGFRMDAVPFLYETGMKDEPRSNDASATPDVHGYLNHIYTQNQQDTFDLIYQFREVIDDFNKAHPDEDPRIMMTEAYADIKTTMRYYGDGKRLGAHFTFNFELIPLNLQSNARDVVTAIQKWLTYMPIQFTPNWVLGNHDQHRIATRIGVKNVDGFNMLVAMLPGVQVTYNGEEIGMENGFVGWEQGQDPGACNGPPEDFNKTSRDFERTPYHWDDTKNAGFSDGDSTWLPVSEKYHENNLGKQRKESNSHYKVYQQMTSLRRSSKELQEGEMEIIAYSDSVLALRRYLMEGKTHVFLFNMGDQKQRVNLVEKFYLTNNFKIVVSNVVDSKGHIMAADNVFLKPYESIVAVSIDSGSSNCTSISNFIFFSIVIYFINFYTIQI